MSTGSSTDHARQNGAVLDGLAEIVFHTDGEGRWTYLNRAWEEITGFAIQSSLGRPFLEFLHPEEIEDTLRRYEVVASGQADICQHVTRLLTSDGESRWIELRARAERDDGGNIVSNSGTIIDISERRQAEELLAAQTRILELIAHGTPLHETLREAARVISDAVGAPVRFTVRDDRGTGPGWRSQNGPVPLELPVMSARGVRLGTLVIERPESRRVSPALHELVDRLASLAALAIERDRAEQALRERALRDPLTNVANRTLLHDRLEQALRQAKRRDGEVGLFLLDLDRFKALNDNLGHAAGDAALQALAERARQALRAEDTVARIGGDEFAVVLPGLGRTPARHVAAQLLERVRAPLTIDGRTVRLGASLGVAVYPEDGAHGQMLIERADAAMYRAKRRGGGLALFDSELDGEQVMLAGLVDELRRALDRDELFVHYQPKVELTGLRTCGVEALVRWNHPARGVLPPDTFIGLAEQSGLIGDLTLWVLRRALADYRVWSEKGVRVPLAVNISPAALHDPGLPGRIASLVTASSLGWHGLELEITERAVLSDHDAVRHAMAELEGSGLTFAVDDFGTGYSSLAALKRIHPRALKIDKSFVRDMTVDARDASIVRSSIELAHSLGIGVVAEGVETGSICNLLREAGCDEAQGYHFARPMPPDQLLAWMCDRDPIAC